MIELTRRSGIAIPTSFQNETFYQKIRAHLYRRARQYNTPDYVIQKFFIETDKYLTIPRFFPVHEYVNCKIKDISHEGEDIEIEHSITPRNVTQENAIKHMLKYDSGIVELNPGMGKTVISIYMIAERKKKTIVLVHRDGLVKQWRNRVVEHSNLNESDIAILSSTKFEEDLKKPIIIATNQLILSILKRKRMEFLIALDKANIGIFIGDEVHTTIGAPTFSEASIHIPAKVVWGLSATPYRWDGNTDIIDYHLGKTYSDEDTSDTMPARVTVLLFDFGIDIPKRYKYLRWEGQFQRSRYLNLIKNSKMVLGISNSILEKFRSRHVLYVAERLNLLGLVSDAIEHESKAMFTAGCPLEALEENLTFSTPGKCRDGIDAPWKDVCVLTSPIKNIHQMVGRINRKHPGKQDPIVVDMVDIGCPEISNTYFGRNQYYNDKGWKVQYIVVDQAHNLHPVDEKVAINILRG